VSILFAARDESITAEVKSPLSLELVYRIKAIGCHSVQFTPRGTLITNGKLLNEVYRYIYSHCRRVSWSFSIPEVNIVSMCMDSSDTNVILITLNADVIVWNTRTKKPQHRWKCPGLAGWCKAQVAFISTRIFVTHPQKESVIVYTMTGSESLTISLQTFSSPSYLANYDDDSLIISGVGKVGRFPVCAVSKPQWVRNIWDTTGVCVDKTGLIYVGTWSEKTIFILSGSGRILITTALVVYSSYIAGDGPLHYNKPN